MIKGSRIAVQNVNFAEALSLVMQNRFRRVSDIYVDTKTGKYDVAIYRCSDTIVRCEFSKPVINKHPPSLKLRRTSGEEKQNGKTDGSENTGARD